MSETTKAARAQIDRYDEGKTTGAQVLALIAIAEALERIAAVKEREQAEDSRRRT